jgi:microcystin-dependent protein
MNSDLSDIADALTNSLARNGAGGMTAVLPLANDGFTFQNDPDTGISRSAANTMSHECGGSEVMNVSATGVSVTGAVSATGIIKQSGFPILPVGLGPLPWSGLSAPAGWVLCYGQALSRTTYASLWAFAQAEIAAGNTLYGNGDGTTTFTIADMRGRVPGGKDNMGGTAASRLTAVGLGVAGTTLGNAGSTESYSLVTGNLPPYTPSGAIAGTSLVGWSYDGYQPPGGGSRNAVNLISNVSLGNSASLNLTGTFTGAAQGGTSAAFSRCQPTIITNYIIFAGV